MKSLNNSLMKAPTNRLGQPLIGLVLIYFFLVIVGASFADRGWYEVDGIAILAGSVNLPAAKQGNFFLFSYYTQPLTYELNHLIYNLSGQAYFLYLLPLFSGALAVCFLAFALYQFLGKKVNVIFCFCFLLFFPEIIFRLLYPNSSVLAMLMLSLCLSGLFFKPQPNNRRQLIRYSLIGFCSSLAFLFRADFLLSFPILVYLILTRAKGKQPLVFYCLGNLFGFLIAFLSRIFQPFEILRHYKFHLALGESLTWARLDSLKVFFSITSPLVWFVLIVAFLFWLQRACLRRDYRFLFILVPLLILIYPVFTKLTSAHYILPAIILAPFALAKAIVDFSQSRLAKSLNFSFHRLVVLVVICSLTLQFVSVELKLEFPYLKVSLSPAYVNTYDGLRVPGAYLKGYAQVINSNRRPYWQGIMALSQGLANVIAYSEADFVIVGLNQRIAQNYLLAITTYSLAFFLQVKGYQLKFSPQGLILTGRNNQAIIKQLDFAQYQAQPAKKELANTRFIKIPLVSRRQANRDQILKQFWLDLFK